MKRYLLLFAFLPFLAQAQIVDIPDANFKNALVNESVADLNGDGNYNSVVDTNNDGEIQQSEAEAVLGLNVEDRMITSVVGLQAFINLKVLFCNDNDLTALDVSALTALEVIGAWDVDAMTQLDLSNNPNLISIEADSNNLLTHLNIANGANENLVLMWADNNPMKLCIQVDDVDYANAQTCAPPVEWCKDATGFYTLDCELGFSEVTAPRVVVGPNPVRDRVRIQTEAPLIGWSLYDVQGRLIQEADSSDQVNVSKLPSGLYLLHVQTEAGRVSQKLIKE